MKGRFLVNSHGTSLESNIYADKSALILSWLLKEGIARKDGFSLREVADAKKVSIGLTQRIFEVLVSNGVLRIEGVRTTKRFFLKKPALLLKRWLDHYSIVKKCKMWNYRSHFQNRDESLEALKKSKLRQKVALALHAAAEALKCKNTNLNTLELYVLDPAIKPKLEKVLQLEPQEKGYEVLLIKPYYKHLLNASIDTNRIVNVSPPLLTFLDLYHFPLRGQEQAEFLAERIPELNSIYTNG